VSADVASPPGRLGWPRLPWIVLVLSLVLNLCFLGGFLWLRLEAAQQAQMTPAERFAEVSRKLALDPDQRAAFERFVGFLRMRTRHMRETNQPMFGEIWRELGKPKPDDDKIDHDLAEAASNRHAYQLEVSHAMRQFLATLNDQQRASFVELVQSRQKDTPPLLRQLAP
jgi:uncharacterized membrane protein